MLSADSAGLPDATLVADMHHDAAHSFDLPADLLRELRPGVIFPICFDALLRMRQMLRMQDATPRQLAGAVLVDPLVCARLLRRANRSRPATPITGIRNALMRVGAERTRRIASAVSGGQIDCARQLTHVDVLSHRLWLHTLRTAAGAFVIAQRLTSIDPDEAMTAGLLHDIGTFHLLDRLVRHPHATLTLQAMIGRILEWHEAIGESLLHSLGVPVVLIEAMRDHEQPRVAPATLHTLSDVVFIANVLAGGATELYGDPVCHVSQRPDPVRERFAGLLPDIEQEFAALRGVPVDHVPADQRRP
jgi:HD-like signal output (HDOD) protein